ncbi:MAG: TOBE domain-containing protein, partial [Candidatus Izemoplasmatales bacterium]
VSFCDREFECVDRGFDSNELVDVVIRPEDFDFVPPSKAKITGVVDSLIFKGVHYEINVIVDDHEYTIHTTKFRDVGQKVGLAVTPDNIHVMKRHQS